MGETPFHGLNLDVNQDLPLTPVTSTDPTSYRPITQHGDLTITAFHWDPDLFQTSSPSQAFEPSQLLFSSPAPQAQAWPSLSPHTTTDSTYSYFPNSKQGELTDTTFSPDPSLFLVHPQSQAVNVSELPLSSPDLMPSPDKSPSTHSTTTAKISPRTQAQPEPTSPNQPHHNTTLPSHGEMRKSRRRAQNRTAQRAFRARKEQSLRESSVHVQALQCQLERLETRNGSLSDTVGDLRDEICRLRREPSVFWRGW